MPKVTIEGDLGIAEEMRLALRMTEPFATAKTERGTTIKINDEHGWTREALIRRLEKLGLKVLDE